MIHSFTTSTAKSSYIDKYTAQYDEILNCRTHIKRKRKLIHESVHKLKRLKKLRKSKENNHWFELYAEVQENVSYYYYYYYYYIYYIILALLEG